MKNKWKVFLWKLYWKLFPPETVAEQIRSLSDRDLVFFVHKIQSGDELWADFAKQFCESCQKTSTAVINGKPVDFYPCDDFDLGCPHGDDVYWWLRQEVQNEEL